METKRRDIGLVEELLTLHAPLSDVPRSRRHSGPLEEPRAAPRARPCGVGACLGDQHGGGHGGRRVVDVGDATLVVRVAATSCGSRRSRRGISRLAILSVGACSVIELDILGRVIAVPTPAVARLRDMAAARAGLSSSHRDLSLVLDRGLRRRSIVLLQRGEARALLELVEEASEDMEIAALAGAIRAAV